MPTFHHLRFNYLLFTNRTTCRACYHMGIRGTESQVMNPIQHGSSGRNKGRLLSHGNSGSGEYRRRIIRATVKHYAQYHPEQNLDQGYKNRKGK